MGKRPEIEDAWQDAQRGRDGAIMTVADLPDLIRHLDQSWGLEGMFARKLPKDFRGLLADVQDDQEVLFSDFWQWFEEYVAANDVLRASAFIEAEERRVAGERQKKKEEEESLLREQALQEVLVLRRRLEEEFDALIADIYLGTGDDEFGKILNKGAVIQGTEEKESGPPLKGRHISLILAMLELWGCPLPDDEPEDEWTQAAVEVWNRWLKDNGPRGTAPGRVDSLGLKALLNKDGFQAYLEHLHPVQIGGTEAIDDLEEHHMVEVKGIFEDNFDIFVEAIDDETGEVLQLPLPDHQADEVRRRLEAGAELGPLLARVDVLSNRICELISPAHHAMGDVPLDAP